MKTKAISEKIKAIAAKVDFDDPERIKAQEEFERNLSECTANTSSKIIKKSTDEAKALITQSPSQHEQLTFSFMPTQLTRTSPFFPMSRKNMSNREFETLEWETSWGKISFEGRRLSVFDESVLLSLLVLVRKHRAIEFETTQNELCKISKTSTGKNTYQAIWKSIQLLSKTHIDLDIYEGKGANRKIVRQMTGNILTFGDRQPINGKLKIVFNPYFIEMYAQSFITNLDLEFRASLKGDIAKALYRFYSGQRDFKYSCHVLTLAKAVNINTNLEIRRIRERIRTANRELKNKGYLSKAILNKHDIVTIWKKAIPRIAK